ncbi:hypothetical protein DM01DRAFT_1335645 [Hesseltinella vesiculosa]|uniref:PX domain-containing protein n=1 Tax=Hesseltinella vesiculosa TaxID=101127 RepID=A0A1X2GIH0_9FUNG|nr:hypothetical protein DM01DRAFT_1335645 [Hesseltinella vesiculosa]
MSTSILAPSNSLRTGQSGIKLAPLIRQARVVSYERRQGKVWYVIHVDPQQFNNLSTCLRRQSYTISRRYEDCVQFSQRLHDAFPCLTAQQGKYTKQEPGYTLPKLKSQGLLNKKASHGQRRAELDRFVQALFRLPVAITQTLVVVEFFGLHKADTEEQVLRDKQNMVRQQQAIINANHGYAYHLHQQQIYAPSHAVSIAAPTDDLFYRHHPIVMPTSSESESFIKWPKLKSFSSSTSLSNLCSHAANRLPSWSTLSSSCSTTLKKKSSLTSTYTSLSSNGSSFSTSCYGFDDTMPSLVSFSSSSTTSSFSSAVGPQPHLLPPHSGSVSSASTTSCPSEPTTPVSPSHVVRMIKLKVIYDVDNIVVVQIPRSTSLAALRTRLHDKFSTMLDPSVKPLANDFMLLYNKGSRTSSASSLEQPVTSSSAILTSSAAITLISKEKHWDMALKSWDPLDKVTLRCIH